MPLVPPSVDAIANGRARSHSRAEGLTPCVVVGLEQNGLGVVRTLGRMGIPVIAVHGSEIRPHAATRFAETVRCSDLRTEALIDTLVDIASGSSVRPVLIATMDRTVTLLTEHRPVVDRYFSHALPPPQVIDRLMNKAATDAFAREHGFLVPRTFDVRDEADFHRCESQITFPCVLKPQVKTVDFVANTPRKAFLVQDRDDLHRTYQLVAQWEPEVVIQEWVPGPDNRLVFCLYYFDRNGQPLASFTGRKLRQYIPYCGTACSAEPWNDEFVRDAGIRFFQLAGYSGFGAIEFKIDPEGRYHLIEPTVGRTEHLFALAAANGVNLPYIGYCDMARLAAPAPAPGHRRHIYLDCRRDMRAASFYVAKNELTWRQWLKSVAGPKQYALFAWDDPAPFARQATARASRAVQRVRRRFTKAADEYTTFVKERIAGVQSNRVVHAEPKDNRTHMEAAIAWLSAAQDATGVGGVARSYAVSRRSTYPVGWQPAYPETTGYIIPTFYDCAVAWKRPDLSARARRMADWEVAVQLPNGGFPGSTVDQRAPAVVFNTGMILLGLSRTYKETRHEPYLEAARRGVEFLIRVQSPDGAWRRFTSAVGDPIVHAYDLLVCAGLLSAAGLLGDACVHEAARRNLDFALTLQQPNGWIAMNGSTPKHNAGPPTHTIGYAAAGLLECGELLDEPRYVEAATRVAEAVLPHVGDDGFLPGKFDKDWTPAASWCCLTGNMQMAIVWWNLYNRTGDPRYAAAAARASRYVKCRQDLTNRDAGIRGGIAGSFPMNVDYGRYQYLNWAAKFFIDALILEERAGADHQPRLREGSNCV